MFSRIPALHWSAAFSVLSLTDCDEGMNLSTDTSLNLRASFIIVFIIPWKPSSLNKLRGREFRDVHRTASLVTAFLTTMLLEMDAEERAVGNTHSTIFG
jgi:hypothetical protein